MIKLPSATIVVFIVAVCLNCQAEAQLSATFLEQLGVLSPELKQIIQLYASQLSFLNEATQNISSQLAALDQTASNAVWLIKKFTLLLIPYFGSFTARTIELYFIKPNRKTQIHRILDI